MYLVEGNDENIQRMIVNAEWKNNLEAFPRRMFQRHWVHYSLHLQLESTDSSWTVAVWIHRVPALDCAPVELFDS